MRRLLRALDLRDALATVGAALLTIGLAKIYEPAAYLGLGLLLLALAVWRVK